MTRARVVDWSVFLWLLRFISHPSFSLIEDKKIILPRQIRVTVFYPSLSVSSVYSVSQFSLGIPIDKKLLSTINKNAN